jgi:hypothetical protein
MSVFHAPITITLTAAGTSEVTGTIPSGTNAVIVVCTMPAAANFQYPSYSVGFATAAAQMASGINPGFRTTSGSQQGNAQWDDGAVGFATQSGVSAASIITVTTFTGTTLGLTKANATYANVTCTVYPIVATSTPDITLGNGINGAGNALVKTGLAFQPGALLYISCGASANNATNGPRLNFGMATSASAEWSVGVSAEWNQNPSDVVSRVLTDRIGPVYRDNFTYAASQFAVSAIASDGYTIEQVTSSNQLNIKFAILALPGTFALLTGDVRASTGTEATTGAGFAPSSAFFALSALTTATDTPVDGWSLSLGGGTLAAQRVADIQNPDNTATPNPTPASTSGAVMRGSNTSGQTSLANIDSFDADGFTLDWTDADATAGLWAALVSEAAASGPAFRSYYITG